jgi:hypothetical protein
MCKPSFTAASARDRDCAQQSARSLELRATTNTMLAETYHWFTEGFDTADLKDA